MWRFRLMFGGGEWKSAKNKDAWLDAMLRGLFNPKAPKTWVAAQAAEGRPPVAAYSIWAKYPLPRKWAIWAAADDADARAAGYLIG